ncbi:MAG: hypothetical protein QM687_14420 [Ferruginibacter sp.]
MKIYFLSVFFLFFYGCNEKKDNFYLEQHYKNGRVKSKGWYTNDTIPSDTIFYYYENGNIEQIVPHNKKGWKIGEVLNYDTNGVFLYTQKYFENSDFGFVSRYQNNKLILKNLFYQNNTYGDEYGYDSSGRIEHYYFWDFRENVRNMVVWENGKIKSKEQKLIYFDSVRIEKSEIRNRYNYDIIVIISNPPNVKTLLDIYLLQDDKKILEKIQIENRHFFYRKIRSDEFAYIQFSGKQYDSLTNKMTFHTGLTSLKRNE